MKHRRDTGARTSVDASPAKTPKKRNPVWALLITAGLLAVAAIAVFWPGSDNGAQHPDPDSTASATPTAPSTTPPATPDSSNIALFIDGWSLQNTGTRGITYSVLGDNKGDVEWRPAGREDIEHLLAVAPGAVEQVLARMVTSDATLRCDTDGCETSSSPVDPDVLLHPSTIPGFGRSYEAYGIKSGLYVAHLPVKQSSEPVVLHTDRDTITLRETSPSPELPDQKHTPKARNGYLSGTYIVSAGLGQLFFPHAAWLDDNPQVSAYYSTAHAVSDVPDGQAADLAKRHPDLIAYRGVGQALEAARNWDTTLLSYASSPTTGCGPSALCIPGGDPDVKLLRNKVMHATVTDDEHEASLVVQDIVLAIDLDGPIHQFGLRDDWSRGNTGTLVEGPQTLHFVHAVMYTDKGAIPWASMGLVSDEHSSASVTLADVLKHISPNSETWSVVH